jgi:hypothetical protein
MMDDTTPSIPPFLIIALILPGLWVLATVISTLSAAMSGWFTLAARFPDRPEQQLDGWEGLSGTMGRIYMREMLTLCACPSGLRISAVRFVAPFCRNIFVPWDAIALTRRTDWRIFAMARLTFGNPPVGRLKIEACIADEIAEVAGNRWPAGTS